LKGIMKKISYKRVLPVLVGAILGYSYYHFIGCNSGSCAITSNPYISTVYGAFLGLVLAIPSKKKNEKSEN
jgi:hypothetical protein